MLTHAMCLSPSVLLLTHAPTSIMFSMRTRVSGQRYMKRPAPSTMAHADSMLWPENSSSSCGKVQKVQQLHAHDCNILIM